MTEKLLLYGGALQQAGAVRMKGEQRATQSDFMEMEKQRGISIRLVYYIIFMTSSCVFIYIYIMQLNSLNHIINNLSVLPSCLLITTNFTL